MLCLAGDEQHLKQRRETLGKIKAKQPAAYRVFALLFDRWAQYVFAFEDATGAAMKLNTNGILQVLLQLVKFEDASDGCWRAKGLLPTLRGRPTIRFNDSS